MSTPVLASSDPAENLGSSDHAQPPRTGLKAFSVITGLLGFLLFVLTPLMPINQVQSSFSWPQGDLESVNAPLISYAPEQLDVHMPVDAVDDLREGQNLLLSTLPQDSPEAANRGLMVRSTDGDLVVSTLKEIVVRLDPQEVKDLRGEVLDISIGAEGSSVKAEGTTLGEVDSDQRPQVSGIYTELDNNSENYQNLVDQGLSAQVEINSRFTSSPTVLKLACMIGGVVMAVLSLGALYRLDRADGRGFVQIPSEWKKLRATDLMVLAGIAFWYVFGGNTSDDGFILTMARASEHADYIANYYRWYGVPESPFGSPYYDLLAAMAQVSTASMWMRLPQLVAAILTWLFVSKSMLPRLGEAVASRRIARWSAALLFLAFWTAYNNGLRPEPIIALGVVVTWVCFERAIATARLFPAALGVLAAAFSLSAGPTGLMAVAALLVSLAALVKILVARLKIMGSGPTVFNVMAIIAPFLAAGTAVCVAVFGDQSLASALESTRVRGIVGPSLAWYQEYSRYAALLLGSVDGSVARRFPVIMAFFALAVVLYSKLRSTTVPGTNSASITRLLLVFAGAMFFMTFTPTKWTHHFGVWAGLSAAVAAVAAVSLANYARQSRSTRLFLVAAVMAVGAVSLAGINGWWYVSSFGVPWWDKTPQIFGIEFATVALVFTLVVFGIAVLASFLETLRRPQNVSAAEEEENAKQARMADALAENATKDEAIAAARREEEREKRAQSAASHSRTGQLLAAPIAIACVAILVISYGSFAKSFLKQWPQYSIGTGNVRELGGTTGQLANDAMIETNTNDSFLSPADGTKLKDSLDNGENSYGFGPNNLPVRLDVSGYRAWPESAEEALDGPQTNIEIQESVVGQPVGTEGGFTKKTGANGSHAKLPFGLDAAKVPVIGSYRQNDQVPAAVTSDWYSLPAERSEDAPIVVITAAGSTERKDVNGDSIEGETLVVEYGHRDADGSVKMLGEYEPIDAFRDDIWRNLRVPLDDLPGDANVIRIKAEDDSLYPGHWLAFTPPRVPRLESVNDLIGSDTPGLLDWPVALQFPDQRSFDHYAGVTEIPRYRVSPDKPGKESLSGFQDFTGGGALGTAEAVNTSYEAPGYLKNDWKRDWGSLQYYSLRTNSEGDAPKEAKIDTETITRSGLWKPSKMQTFRN
ncbi:putative arabinosyltransferase B [Corynebacterium ciconiae DSM 44920]|uniref:arabinosyltransferase domain-containing protein n=1 Tax=Corynebacterium ciconiae TaxID=227319 RepID=UPI0003A26CC2|nr:arabinosyltransferase domain-containing protein [Corynebacterium ciconiae]WKD60136.1 putative arabinosyltransferase B [Corynebacterium ciconiae DSM 44920]